MAVRVLRMLSDVTSLRRSQPGPLLDASIALFIGLKTECVCSPMTSEMLESITDTRWSVLQVIEMDILCDVRWKLYDGALPQVV